MTADLNRDDPRETLPHTRAGGPMTTEATPTRRPRAGAVVLALVVALVLVVGVVLAVQTLREPTPDPTPTAGTTTSAPSEPPTEPTPSSEEPPKAEESAVIAAEQAYREYLQVADQIALAGADVAALETVAIGDALEQARVEAENYQVAGITQVGQPELASLEAQSVSLATTGGAVPEVVLDVCLDVTNFDLVQNGESVIDPNSPDRLRSVVTVRDYPDRGGWLIANVGAEGATC